ncbi:MAG: glycosyltransferase [Candidatus Lokiarchaeota archaeon]|nr:glycosyltransferase [Candidatus Lokiarchaeota archaeon]
MTLKEARIETVNRKRVENKSPELRADTSGEKTLVKNNIISIVIPLFNEENSIYRVLKQIPNHFNYEVIVVDDGSTDNSIEVVKKVEGLDIRIIKHSTNRGYGAAIMTGLRNATGNIVVTLDSDGQHNPKDIPKVIEPIDCDNADIVIGSRYLGNCLYRVPLHTRTGELFIKFILKILFGLKIGNNQSGFRAFSRRSLRYFDEMKYEEMGLTTELLFKSGFNKLKVIEVPIEVSPRRFGRSHVNLLNIVRSVLGCILSYSLKKILKTFYKRVFSDLLANLIKESEEEILATYLSKLLSRKDHQNLRDSQMCSSFYLNR